MAVLERTVILCPVGSTLLRMSQARNGAAIILEVDAYRVAGMRILQG